MEMNVITRDAQTSVETWHLLGFSAAGRARQVTYTVGRAEAVVVLVVPIVWVENRPVSPLVYV
jgi:hypothetical protein